MIVDVEEMLDLFTLEEILEMDNWTVEDAIAILVANGLRLPDFLDRETDIDVNS